MNYWIASLAYLRSLDYSDISDKELEICENIGPELNKRGLVLVGIDVIGDKLTEINVTSPTGFREIQNFNNINLAKKLLNNLTQ